MKRIVLIVAVFLLMLSTNCFAGVGFVFDVQPASMLISSNINGFYASDYGYSYGETETVSGSGSWLPTVSAGIGIDTRPMRIDLKAGGGYLWNNAFSSPVLLADAAFNFKLGRVITLGPHVGVLDFTNPTWDAHAPLKIDSKAGFMGGLDFAAGGRISFLLSLDYVNAKLDVRPEEGSGWETSSDQIDLTGFAIRMGIVGHF